VITDYRFSRASKLARINTTRSHFVWLSWLLFWNDLRTMPIASCQSPFAQWGDINRARNDVLRNNELIAEAQRRIFISIKIRQRVVN